MEYGEPRLDFERLDEPIRAVWRDMRALAEERFEEYYQSIAGDSLAEEVFTRQTLAELKDVLSRHPNQTIPIDLDSVDETLPAQEQLRRLVIRELDASSYLFEHPELQELQDYEISSTLTNLIEQFDTFGVYSAEAAETAQRVDVPAPFVVMDQVDEAVDRERTAFFESVLGHLSINEQERMRDCQVVARELASPDGSRESNDRITMLIINDRLAATVLERRTEFNNTEVAFASHVTPEFVELWFERRRMFSEES